MRYTYIQYFIKNYLSIYLMIDVAKQLRVAYDDGIKAIN
jgi:hypothetical protein